MHHLRLLNKANIFRRTIHSATKAQATATTTTTTSNTNNMSVCIERLL